MIQSHRSMLTLVCTAGAVAAVLLAGAVSTVSAAASLTPLGYLPGANPGYSDSFGFGVSANGSVVVGRSSSASGYQAFRWTSDGGMMGLGYPPGGGSSNAYGVSGDGSIVVGESQLAAGFGAFYWTVESGMWELWDLLLSHGVDPAADGWYELSSARGISADGTAIVGFGIRNNTYEAFVAVVVVPDRPAPGDFDHDCDVDEDDLVLFENCASGPAIPLAPGCEDRDLDDDDDADQTDFGVVQRCFSGPGNPADPNCAD